MAGKHSKVIGLILSVVIFSQIAACNFHSADDILGSAASSYAYGKETEAFDIPDSEKTLDDMINRFSGSYDLPEEEQLTDDDFIDLMRTLFDPDFDLYDNQTEPTSTSEYIEPSETSGNNTEPSSTTTETTAVVTPINNVVSSVDDLSRVIHNTLDNTETMVTFSYAAGFYFELKNNINILYEDIQRVDPIDGSGVAQWQWWNRGNDYTLIIIYHYDVEEFKQMKAETAKLVKQVVSNLNLKAKSDYDIVYAVNDYLIDNVYYPETEPYEPVTHTAYGALKNGCAVCEGYASAASLILCECGIECDIESGPTNSGGLHAWNLVKLDGVWYQLDVCWDDGSGSRLEYFLVDDDFMHKTRTWDANRYPLCSVKYVA